MNEDSREFNKSQAWALLLGKLEDIQKDSRRLFQKMDEFNERVAGHIGNESIHRMPDPRPCRYFEDHVKDHEQSKAWTRGLVMLAIVNAIGLLGWAVSVVFTKG